MTRNSLAVLLVAVLGGVAGAEEAKPTVLRFATIAPSGSPWARELLSFGRMVEEGTGGNVKVKWYFNAIAGDEDEEGQRLRRGQLEGVVSSQFLCEQTAPSMRIARMPGVFQSRDEAIEIMNQLKPIVEHEAHESGITLLGTTGLGGEVLFTRRPVRTLADLRATRLWYWDQDKVSLAAAAELGLQSYATAPWLAGDAYDQGKVDGFVSIPTAALVFQWSKRAHYAMPLRMGYLFGCVVMQEAVFSKLPIAYQTAMRDSLSHVRERIEEVGRQTDESLMNGLLAKQGVTIIQPSESLRSEFFAATHAVRTRVQTKFVKPEVLNRVTDLLANYRAEHGNGPGR
jgi:TRAP-type C4-dicarboxylate transport system substrate-binding protein